MKKLTSLAFAAVLASTGTAAFAEQDIQKGDQVGPVAMTDAQMDNVAAGALVNVFAIDVVDVNQNQVQVAIPVAANAAIAVLGGAVATGATAAGNLTQRR